MERNTWWYRVFASDAELNWAVLSGIGDRKSGGASAAFSLDCVVGAPNVTNDGTEKVWR